MHLDITEEVWLERALPLLRSQKRRGTRQKHRNDRVIALYPDRLILANLMRFCELGEDVHGEEGYKQLCWLAGSNRTVIHYDDIETLQLRAASLGRAQFRISFQGRQTAFSLPIQETPHIIRALQLLLGERFLITLPQAEWMLPVFARPAPKKPSKDRVPIRSLHLSVILKGCGLLCVAAPLFAFFNLVSRIPNLFDLCLFLCSFLLPFLGRIVFRWGREAGMPSFEETNQKDTRPPILYLRSFDDDQLKNRLFHPAQQPGFPLSVILLQLLFRPLSFIRLLAHFYRFLLGLDSHRNEDHLARALNDIGPFIAVGKPGEILTLTGAVRAYLSDNAWEPFVQNQMQKAQMVLLQIAPTKGTWWEFEQCQHFVAPQKLVLLLTSTRESQQRYEEIRLLSWDMFSAPLPVVLPDFVVFDGDWKPSAHFWKFDHRLSTFLLDGPSIDVKASLAPMLAQRSAIPADIE